MRLDVADSSGHGGNSNTGNNARAFFSDEKRDHVVDLLPGSQEEKEKFRELLERFSLILRIVSSKKVQFFCQQFELYCNETYLKLFEYFPWVNVTGSVHRLLGHSAERMIMNNGYGLGNFSEEALEVVHKKVRQFREHGSRKNSIESNITDTLRHWFLQTDPILCSFARTFTCSLCNGTGHTCRSCPQKKGMTFKSNGDALFESFVCGENHVQ